MNEEQLSSVDSFSSSSTERESADERRSHKDPLLPRQIDQVQRIASLLKDIDETTATSKHVAYLQAIIQHLANLSVRRLETESHELGNRILQASLRCYNAAPSRLQLRFRKVFEDLRFTFENYCRESPYFQEKLLDVPLFLEFKSVFLETETGCGAQNAAYIPLASTNISTSASNDGFSKGEKRPRKTRYFGESIQSTPAVNKQTLLLRAGAKYPLDEILRVLLRDQGRTIELAQTLPQQIPDFVKEASWLEESTLPLDLNRLRYLCELINTVGDALLSEPPSKKRKTPSIVRLPVLPQSGTSKCTRRSGHEGSSDTIWQSTVIRKQLRLEQIEDILHLRDLIRDRLAASLRSDLAHDLPIGFSARRPPDGVLRDFCVMEVKRRHCSFCGVALGCLADKRLHLRLHILRLSFMLPDLLNFNAGHQPLPLKSLGRQQISEDWKGMQGKKAAGQLSMLFKKVVPPHILQKRTTSSSSTVDLVSLSLGGDVLKVLSQPISFAIPPELIEDSLACRFCKESFDCHWSIECGRTLGDCVRITSSITASEVWGVTENGSQREHGSGDAASFQPVADYIMASVSLRNQLASLHSLLKFRSSSDYSSNSGVIPEGVSGLVKKVVDIFSSTSPNLSALKASLEFFYLMNETAEATAVKLSANDRKIKALIQTIVKFIQLTLKGQGVSLQELMGLAPSAPPQVLAQSPRFEERAATLNSVIASLQTPRGLADTDYFSHPICLLSYLVSMCETYEPFVASGGMMF